MLRFVGWCRGSGLIGGQVLLPVLGCLAVLPMGCSGGDDSGAADAGLVWDSGQVFGDASHNDGALEPAVDFALSSCPSWGVGDDGHSLCEGTAPMDLGFHALVSRPVDSYLWDFGDGSQSEESDPRHRFDRIGTFTVSLMVRGDFGVLSISKERLVRVRLSELGEDCLANDTCRWGLCLCGEGQGQDGCVEDFEGYCTESCALKDCDRGLCADLREGLRDVDSPPVWRQPICLPGCLADTDCTRPGTECRVVPIYDRSASAPVSSWAKACIAPVLQPLGGQCRDSDGLADDSACLSGRCWDVGAFGECAAPCIPGSCPAGSHCLSVGEAESGICLLPCGNGQSCTQDPLLECRGEGGDGAFRLTVLDEDAEQGLEFCAPKVCSREEDCAPAGTCDLAAGGYCRPAF